MKTFKAVLVSFFAIVLLMAPAAEPSKPVRLNEVPPPARKAIETQLAGAKITTIERDDEDGVSFTVSYKAKDGAERDFTVGEDGTLIRIEVAVEETPIPVQRTIKAQVGTG